MYEAHITLDPIDNPYELASAQSAALEMKFSLGDEPIYSTREARHQAFMTGHSPTLVAMQHRIRNMVYWLQGAGHKVHRYKIEHIVIDSKASDELDLLSYHG